MLSETFNKQNLDGILKELAKEYKKLGGKRMPAEIILIGGAAIISHYGFREMTTDIDAIIMASSMMKDAINHVGDRFGLPNGWLNDDFRKTGSYSDRLSEVSKYYKSYFGVLSVRVISAEYLIAMKLKAGRKYKNDFSDIAGILAEHKNKGEEITYQQIETAIEKLYGNVNAISDECLIFIKGILSEGNFEKVYSQLKENEKQAKNMLISFEEAYPGETNADNVNNIVDGLKEKLNKSSILDHLKERKEKYLA